MKIGIISTPLYANYGGVLQNYALQQVLKKMGHSPITLDYMPSLSFWRYCLYAGKTIACSVIPSKRHPLKPFHHFLSRSDSFKSFVNNYIARTSTVSAYSSRQLSKEGVEALVVGSDQVWRYSYSNEIIYDMFLEFAEKIDCRKLSYAASFGIEKWEYPEEVTKRIMYLVKSFHAVSVREASGVNLCKNYLGVEAQLVLDPTLLLSEEDYAPLCSMPEGSSEPYLASYILDADVRKQMMIESFAAGKGLVVRNMTVSEDGCSIEEWLSTIRNADFVVTDSFHGSVFSIIFGKQFYSFINRARGADRFNTLFHAIGLNERLIDDCAQTFPANSEIGYASVYEKLESFRKKSFAFLQQALA